MSVRNGLPYIRQTVPSVLGQTFRDFEFVIVDNASTDGTRDYLRELAAGEDRVRVLWNDRDLGHSGGLNRGLAECRAEWIARIDADDIALPHRLDRQWTFIQEHPEVAVTSCFAYYINQHGVRKGQTFHDLTTVEKFREYQARNAAIGLLHPGVFMRRDVVLAAGGYREAFGAANDIDLWARISEQGRVILVQPEYLIEYRVHPGAIGSRKLLEARLKFEWARACLIARRAGLPEPAWEAFLQNWRSAPLAQRLNRQRKFVAKACYRRAGERYLSGGMIKSAGWFAVAALLQPGYALGRVRGQLLKRGAAEKPPAAAARPSQAILDGD